MVKILVTFPTYHSLLTFIGELTKPYKELSAVERAQLEAELPSFIEHRQAREESRESKVKRQLTELRNTVSTVKLASNVRIHI